MTLQPKAEFLKSPAAKHHAELSADPAFHQILEIALVEMLMREGTPANPEIASASWHRISGARAFTAILLSLAEPPEPRKEPDPRQNLSFPKH